MKTYTVTANVTISIYTEVEAKSEKEALRIAGDREQILANEWGQDWQKEEMWVADDYDGEPMDLRIDS